MASKAPTGVPRLSRFELEIMEAFWTLGRAAIREVQESLREERRPAYTTVQTIVYRLERKGAVRRVRKIGNAHIFEPVMTRNLAQRQLVDKVLDWFGGSPRPLMAQLIEFRKLTLEDLREMERMLSNLEADKTTRK
jgi:BlaI family transcriptional regulator, penicillinase repressor